MIRNYSRETLLHLSETWVENVSFSTLILRTKKLVIDNYRRAHWNIRPQSDNEQGINKLRPYTKNLRLLVTSLVITICRCKLKYKYGNCFLFLKFVFNILYTLSFAFVSTTSICLFFSNSKQVQIKIYWNLVKKFYWIRQN